MTDRSGKTKQIFIELMDLPAAQRKDRLKELTVHDRVLRREIGSLLESFETAGDFLEHPIALSYQEEKERQDAANHMKKGERIDRYEIVDTLGQGGMGIVYRASQGEPGAPIEREVALKLINPNMNSAAVLDRFEQERRTLSRLNHPHVAQIYDNGLTDKGFPYFVMELVEGLTLTRYCDYKRLTIPQRLDLFLQVCRGVQHAHARGVLHRDLKPSNVLVTEYEGRPVAKVIDFGVAHALAEEEGGATAEPRFGPLIGTLEYMSPEQADPDNPDVDVRSDEYALGVLLYELVTGALPIESSEVRGGGFHGVRKAVLRADHTPPSTLLRTRSAEVADAAAARQTTPDRLIHTVGRDLEWIILKSIAKDREQRYPTVDALARDLERFQAQRPVDAAPASYWYVFKRFVRRNSISISLYTCVVVGLVLSLGLLYSAYVGERETRAAEARQRVIADAVGTFLVDEIVTVGIGDDPDDLRRLLEKLHGASRQVTEHHTGRPLVEAGIRDILGQGFLSFGDFDAAVSEHQRAYELNRQYCGEMAEQTLWSGRKLVNALRAAGQTQRAAELASRLPEPSPQ